MKFTKEEAFESLKGFLTNEGKKTLRMSERSIEKQLETLMPLLANDDIELSDFLEKVKPTFSVMNSNSEKDYSDFVKKWEDDHQSTTPKPEDDVKPNEQTSALLKRIEELERENNQRKKDQILSQKRSDLLAAMKKKGIKDKQWAEDFIAEVSITEDLDVDSKAEAYLKIYNKSQAIQPDSSATPGFPTSGVKPNATDPLAAAKAIITQRNKEREGIYKN